jgi:transposase InsO family protein
MDQRLEMLEAVDRFGITVTEACRLYGCSREAFYVWRRRRAECGDASLENLSTAPHHSPGRISWQLESRIVEMRKAHRRWGARRIRDELRRAGLSGVDLPAKSTIERVLARNGLGRQPKPAPPAPKRFQRERANELWQIDAMDYLLADDTKVEIISTLDDRSRYSPALEAVPSLTAEQAISVFDQASAEIGPPESVLSDRGGEFTARASGGVGPFERHLWTRDVYTINGRGYHPQTQGKVERFHRTLREWLDDNGPYTTIDELNAQLAAFRHHYNHQRPHQAINGATPNEVFTASAKAAPDPALAAQHCRRETIRSTRAN